MKRAAALQARTLAFTLYNDTSEKGLEYQREVVSNFLDQPVLQKLLPDSVVDRRRLQGCEVVCNGLAEAWSELKYKTGKDQSLARGVIEAAVMSVEEDERCIKAAATCIGMNRRTLRRGFERRRLLNAESDGELWARIYRKKRRDALPQAVIDTVLCWWEEETRVSPCKKDVRRKRIGAIEYISHATHWLEESQLDLYTRFKLVHDPIDIGYTSFRRLKPYFVRRLRDFNTCCCKHHQEMQEIVVGWNTMQSEQVHLPPGAMSCSCGCPSLCSRAVEGSTTTGIVRCQSMLHTYTRATSLWEKTLCPRIPGALLSKINIT